MTNTRLLLILLGVLALAGLIHLLKPILAPFWLARYWPTWVIRWSIGWKKRRMSRTVSVCVVFTALTLLALIGFLLALPLLIDQAQLLGLRLQSLLQWLQLTVLPELKAHFGDGQTLGDAGQALGRNLGSAGEFALAMWKRISGSGMAVVAWLSSLVLIPVVTFYPLRDWDILVDRIRDLLPRRIEGQASLIARECDDILGAFIRGQLLVMAALAVIYTLGLWLVGLELAMVLGLLAGLASIVPYLGFVVGIIAASAAAWFQFHDLWVLLQVGVVFGVGQVLESTVLTPQLVGDRIGLHPVAVIFALLAGAQLFGFVGILLALPVAAVTMVMLRHVHGSYLGSEFYTAGTRADSSAND